MRVVKAAVTGVAKLSVDKEVNWVGSPVPSGEVVSKRNRAAIGVYGMRRQSRVLLSRNIGDANPVWLVRGRKMWLVGRRPRHYKM